MCVSPVLAGGFFTTVSPGKPSYYEVATMPKSEKKKMTRKVVQAAPEELILKQVLRAIREFQANWETARDFFKTMR